MSATVGDAMKIAAPLTGTIMPLATVCDPVFADGLVGPGIGVDPSGGVCDVLAPVGGAIIHCYPHALVIGSKHGSLLVHVGISTAGWAGGGFQLHCEQGDTVSVGDQLVSFDADAIRDFGRQAVVMVVVLDDGPQSVTRLVAAGAQVTAGQPIMQWAQFA